MTCIRAALFGVSLVFIAPTLAMAQGAGAGADFNRQDRERVKQMDIQACRRGCDSVGRSNSIACGQFGIQAAPTCNLNVQKQTAACYQTCR